MYAVYNVITKQFEPYLFDIIDNAQNHITNILDDSPDVIIFKSIA